MIRFHKNQSFLWGILGLLGVLFLEGCAGLQEPTFDYSGPRTSCHSHFAKKAYNKPYKIEGVWYYPQPFYDYNEVGMASYYGGTDTFHGKKTSNGEIFDMNGVTVAHKTLPIPCIVQITNLENGRSFAAKVNDRGPFIEGRIVDVSRKIAQLLGFYRKGTARVQVTAEIPKTLALVQNYQTNKNTYLAGIAPVSPPKLSPQPAFLSKPVEVAQVSYPRPLRIPQGFIASAQNPIIGNSLRSSSFGLRNVALRKTMGASPKGFFVQAGTFDHFGKAQGLKASLQRYPTPVWLDAVSFNKRRLFRVLVGPFRNSQEAKILLQQLTRRGHPQAMVVYN